MMKTLIFITPMSLIIFIAQVMKYYFFFYKKKKIIFFFPILKKKIKDSGYFDFETPYGYGGPITNCPEDIDFLNSSIDKFKELALKEKIVAGIFRFSPYLSKKCIYNIKSIEKVYSSKTVILNINNEKNYENIFKKYSKDIKTRIKK